MNDSLYPSLESEIAGLVALDLSQLREIWVDRIGPVPKHQSLDLLRRRLAYELQVKAFGGLKPDTRRRLRQLYKAFKARPDFTPLRSRDLKSGSVVTRAWKGQVHKVHVLEKGFEYRGQQYNSLSEIATIISGTKRSGLQFFGLGERRP